MGPAEALILAKIQATGPSLADLQSDIRGLGAGGVPTARLGKINSIQRGVITVNPPQTDATINAVVLSRTMLTSSVGNGISTDADSDFSVLASVHLENSTTVRAMASLSGSIVNYEVVEFSA